MIGKLTVPGWNASYARLTVDFFLRMDRLLLMGGGQMMVNLIRRLDSCKSHFQIVGIHPRHTGDANIKHEAQIRSIQILESDNINSVDFLDHVRHLRVDILVSCNEKQILKEELISLPRLAAINIHAGALPLQRGGGGLYSAFVNMQIAGLTVHHLTAEVDAGDIIAQKLVHIRDSETIRDIQLKFDILGPKLIIDSIASLIDGNDKRISQAGMEYTYTPSMPIGDNLIDWKETSRLIHNRIRGRQSPVWSYTYYDGRKLYVKKSRLAGNLANHVGAVGQVIGRCEDGVIVKTGDSGIVLTEVFYEGEPSFIPSFRTSSMLGINLYVEYKRLLNTVQIHQASIENLERTLQQLLSDKIANS